MLAHFSELGSFHSETAWSEDATFLCDSLCGVDVVASNHAREDTGLDAVSNRLRDTLAEGILNADKTKESHVLADILKNSLGPVVLSAARSSGRPCFEIAVDEADGA